MTKFHINPETGDAGSCRATQGKCPFGSEEQHYDSANEARTAYEANSLELEESGQVWPPTGLPKKLTVIASTADLIRHYNDDIYDGGEGVCLGASAFVSYQLIQKDIPHKLVRGEYTDKNGAQKDHWWIESSNWIIDASRGQFAEEAYKSGVVRANHEQYTTIEAFDPGHKSIELVEAELQRCFSDPAEANHYLGEVMGLEEDSKRLFSENMESVRYS